MEKQSPEANSEPCQAPQTERFAKITIFTILSIHYILDVWQGPEYASKVNKVLIQKSKQASREILIFLWFTCEKQSLKS